jgi:hypothetical protein
MVEGFIVSTGRAGSTLLSKLVAENRQVLSLSEFLGAVDNLRRFPVEPVSGAEFGAMLSCPDDIGVLMRSRGFRIKESTYEHGVADRRWGVLEIPALLAATLPTLTDDPDALFDEIIAFTSGLPTQPAGDQYRALFGWLCERLGRSAWIERAGASLRYFPELRRTFPEGRYVHIHRDGLETALSMREHNWFVLAAAFHHRPPSAELLDQVGRAGDDDTDPIRDMYENKPPVERFGEMWSYMIAKGFQGFAELAPEQLLDVRYEDLIAQPGVTLERIGAFFDLPPDPGWIDRAVATVRNDGVVRTPSLTADERRRLEEACRPGQVLLGRADPTGLPEAYASIRSALRTAGV